MAKRLTRIYTRTGDDGTTGLADGSRVSKDSPRIEAMGTADELNSHLGLLRAATLPEGMDAKLAEIQQRLFDVGAELALPTQAMLQEKHISQLETWLSDYNRDLPPLKDFILPGGGPAAAQCHLARSVCRRAERDLWRLSRLETINPLALIWLNRLSDLLFVQARVLGREHAATETLWQHESPENMK